MEGLHFLIISSDNVPTNQGIILERIGLERYLCYFARVPSYSRVCRLEQIEGWRLFPTEEKLSEFIKSIGSEDDASKQKTPTQEKTD